MHAQAELLNPRAAPSGSVPYALRQRLPVGVIAAAAASLVEADAATPTTPIRFGSGVLPVLPTGDAAVAVALAEVMQEAGLSSLLLPLTSAAAWQSLSGIRAAFPQLQIGVELATANDAEPAAAAGADYLISPSLLPRARAASAALPPALILIRTLRAFRRCQDAGVAAIAIAPASLREGLSLLRTIASEAPAMQIGVTGAIDRQDLPLYLNHRKVSAVVAPWIVAPELLRRRDWIRIGQQASVAAALWQP